MTRRYAAWLLTGTVAATVVGSTVVSLLAGLSGIAVSLVGLLVTWVVCVRCWRIVRRPRLFRLVCAPFGQLWGALFMPTIGAADLGADDNPWAFLTGWLIFAGIYAFMSGLFAGFWRDVEFSRHGAGGGF